MLFYVINYWKRNYTYTLLLYWHLCLCSRGVTWKINCILSTFYKIVFTNLYCPVPWTTVYTVVHASTYTKSRFSCLNLKSTTRMHCEISLMRERGISPPRIQYSLGTIPNWTQRCISSVFRFSISQQERIAKLPIFVLFWTRLV